MEIPVNITIQTAIDMKANTALNLLAVFEGDNLETLARDLTLNDEFVIELFWYFANKKIADKETFYTSLTRDLITGFKERFWAALENFIDPHARPLIRAVKEQLPELLKEQANQLSQEIRKQQSANSGITS